MLCNDHHCGKTYSHMRTGESPGRLFAGGLQKTHYFTKEVTVGNFVEWRRKIELRTYHWQNGKCNVKQVKRTDKHKDNLVHQFLVEKIAPERCSENDEKVGKIAEIHQFAEPCPRHLFTEFEAQLTTEQKLVGFDEMVV